MLGFVPLSGTDHPLWPKDYYGKSSLSVLPPHIFELGVKGFWPGTKRPAVPFYTARGVAGQGLGQDYETECPHFGNLKCFLVYISNILPQNIHITIINMYLFRKCIQLIAIS